MITAGFKNLMKQVLSSGGTSQGLLPIKDVGGTTRYLADYTAYPYTVSTTFTLSASDAGISVGTGNTASSENDYQLANTITSGLTGSVSVSKSVDSNDNSSIVLVVTLTNTTGSDISISEIGYKQECSASDAQDGTSTTDRVFLVDRTVLATPITIPANGQGIIRYTLTTKYGSAGGVEDVLVNGTSVVTAGIARVTVPTVEANPSGTPTADLAKLQIGDGIYGVTNVSANVAVSTLAAPLTTLKINDDEYTVPSGGGTTVVANPSGTATDDLEKIQIGNTIYDIPSGGSGGQSYTCDLLFENDPLPSPTSGTSNVTRTYTLAQPIDDYDAVYVIGYSVYSSSAKNISHSHLILKPDYYLPFTSTLDNPFELNGGNKDSNRRLWFSFPTSTSIQTIANRSESNEEPILYKVYGLKFGTSATHNYSTTEHVVGTWIDGSTLYERTWDFESDVSIPNNSWYTSSIPKAGMAAIVKAEGVSNNMGVYGLNAIAYESNIDYVRLQASRAGGGVSVRYVTLQYTKA